MVLRKLAFVVTRSVGGTGRGKTRRDLVHRRSSIAARRYSFNRQIGGHYLTVVSVCFASMAVEQGSKTLHCIPFRVLLIKGFSPCSKLVGHHTSRIATPLIFPPR